MPDLTFRCGEVPLRYRDEGAGPAVVLIHGWTMDLELWQPQATVLAGSMRVLRYDRRGYGLSGGPADPAHDADDLLGLLDHAGLARTALVGMSQGARTALAAALAAPRRVTALVLDGPPDCVGEPEPDTDNELSPDALRALARASGLDAFRRAWRDHPLMRLRIANPQAQALVDRMIARYRGSDALRPASAAPAPFDAELLAQLALPVLVVNGEHDAPSRLRAAERLLRALPQAERATIPGAGHLANLDNPPAYNDALRAFLGRQARAAA